MSIFPESVDDVRERVKAARANGRAIQPVGGGAQLHIGKPAVRQTEPLHTARLTNLVEYTPPDMVIVAQAGMSLSDLQAILAGSGQWLPVECALPDRQTLGGIVSTRAASLCRAGYGSVRDWLIGIEAVGGDGQLIRGGGRVVKNVTGYDLPRLYCGAWGTLGVITEVAFKVAPLPQTRSIILATLSIERNCEDALDTLLASAEPAQTTLLNHAAAILTLGEDVAQGQYLVVRVEGAAEAVATQSEVVKRVLAPFSSLTTELPEETATNLLRALQDFPLLECPLAAEFHIMSSQVGAFVRMLEWTAGRWGFRASVAAECRTGVIHLQVRPGDAGKVDWLGLLPEWYDKASRVGGSFVVARMPPAWRNAGAPVWSPVLGELRLMEGIKRSLDPGNVFNPGRFVGGL